MKIKITEINNNPFAVPHGEYIGTFTGAGIPQNTYCKRCSLQEQRTLLFSLTDRNGKDDGYVARRQLCLRSNCLNSMAVFLQSWLEDSYYELLDSENQIELDDLKGREAFIEITQLRQPGYKDPYSKIEGIWPVNYLPPLQVECP